MEHDRLTCFLSYNYSYRRAMTLMRQLLEALDVQVEVFDGPSERPPADVVHSEIQKADFLVVLLGPDFDAGGDPSEPARWPNDEAVYAHAQNKPIALIVHPDTRMPGMLEAYQTPARFDFRLDQSYADNVHHVVKHLLNTIRSVRLLPGDLPYYYERVSFRFRVERRGYVAFDVYHQLVARQLWSTVYHCVDSGLDQTDDAKIKLLNEDDVELAATMGSSAHTLALRWGDVTLHSRDYVVTFDPPIPPGGRIGYRRMFELENYFPLTAQELAQRAMSPGFPPVFHQGTTQYYGTSFEVNSEVEALAVTFQFPAKVDVRSCRAVALHHQTQSVNEKETARINGAEMLDMSRSEESGDTTIALKVGRPLSSHSYLLLYEPGG